VAHGAHAAEHKVAELLVAVEAEASIEELVVNIVYHNSVQSLER